MVAIINILQAIIASYFTFDILGVLFLIGLCPPPKIVFSIIESIFRYAQDVCFAREICEYT